MEQAIQDLVWQRADSTCEYCQMPQEVDLLAFQIDHIVARKHRGPDSADNLALACFACNNHKGPNIAGMDPQSGQMTRLFHPRRDLWNEHFEWRGPELVARTSIGRVTAYVLEFNLPHRVELRRSLMTEGVFPRQPRQD